MRTIDKVQRQWYMKIRSSLTGVTARLESMRRRPCEARQGKIELRLCQRGQTHETLNGLNRQSIAITDQALFKRLGA